MDYTVHGVTKSWTRLTFTFLQSQPWAYILDEIQKDTWNPMFIIALLTIVNTQKQPKCPSTDDWME